MAEVRFETDDPTACLLLDLKTGDVWQGTTKENGALTHLGQMNPGVAQAFTRGLDSTKLDSTWI